jgi:hypothetical protein
MQYVSMTGDFLKMTGSDIYRPVEAALVAVGNAASDKMKEYTKKHDYRGELTNSITWRTATNHGEIENSEDLIDAPPINCVDVGSGNKKAVYAERGTGPHINATGTADFVAEIIEWAASKGIDESGAWAIIKTIRNEGTDERPFAAPVFYQGRAIARPIMEEAMRTFWAKQKQV